MRAFQGPLGARSLKSHRGPPTPPEGAAGVLTGPCCVGSSPGRVAYKSHATKATAARAAPRYMRSLRAIFFGSGMLRPRAPYVDLPHGVSFPTLPFKGATGLACGLPIDAFAQRDG